MTGVEDARTAATLWATRAVREVVTAQYGPDAMTERPIGYGYSSRLPEPADYAQGIDAARLVAGRVAGLIHTYTTKARGQGTSWADLAPRLGVDPDADQAVVAFEQTAGRPRQFGELTVSWQCASCGRAITDRGPYTTNPDDNETGHADDCARHQDEVQQYQERMDDDG